MNSLPLRDIHLPDAVSWWPPAIGWWLLILAMIAIVFLVYKLVRHLKHKPLNKLALNDFNNIIKHFDQHRDQTRLAQELSILLRRISISYQPRQQVASLTGQQWLDVLNNMTKSENFSAAIADILFNAPYQKQTHYNSDELIQCCRNWIQQLPGDRRHDPV